MSASIALKAAEALTPVVLSKAIEMKNANKQAAITLDQQQRQSEIALDQQQRQAKNELMIGLAPHAVQLVAECAKASASLQEIQQKSEQIAFEREKMQSQAELEKQVAANRHAQEMGKLHQMGNNYKQAIQANQQGSSEVKDSLTQNDHLIAQVISAMLQPELDNEARGLFAQVFQRLHAQKTQLIEEHTLINSQSHSAFIHSCDAHFKGPRTFTDVG